MEPARRDRRPAGVCAGSGRTSAAMPTPQVLGNPHAGRRRRAARTRPFVKVVPFCGGQGASPARLRGDRSQADGADRPVPGAAACHALRRTLRVQGLRPLSRLQGGESSSSNTSTTPRRCRTTSSCPMAVARWSSCEPTSRIGGTSSIPDCMRRSASGSWRCAASSMAKVFLANYADVLTDARMDLLVEDF